jgi:hypothetical protein
MRLPSPLPGRKTFPINGLNGWYLSKNVIPKELRPNSSKQRAYVGFFLSKMKEPRFQTEALCALYSL